MPRISAAIRYSDFEQVKRCLVTEYQRLADAALIPVHFQFVLSLDKKAFQLGYVDELFGTRENALTFIYQ